MDFFLEHFDKLLILGLLLALFFKESLTEFINAKLGIETEEKVPAWGARLVQYANHDTTEKLNKLILMEEKEHEQADGMRETLRNIDRTLVEFREYGIKHRKD